MQEKLYSQVLTAAPFLRDAVEKFLAMLVPRVRELDEALAKSAWEDLHALAPVSYTHLTLPTIYSV